MKITKFTVGILMSMILLSICVAYVINVFNTDALKTEAYNKQNYISIGESTDNLIWILQISDIHISIFYDHYRITEFKEFCQYTVSAIRPSIVLASGDLTDAKTKDAIGSEQYEDEWRYYRDILKDTKVNQKTLWLDIRGNHDNFNVVDPQSKQNYFTNYSIQGREHPRSYMYQIKKGSVLYTFIGVDACLEPGPRRPFNFIGMLDDLEVNEIETLIRKAEENQGNYTVFFGHFPTSCILTESAQNVRDLLGKHRPGLGYLCGHLHKLGGLVPKMYTLQQAGFLELELGDWKDNRVFRLLAIDHGFLSFTDVRHREWPVILITNPKHAMFVNPAKENWENVKNSTHIRILAFSLSEIDFVKVKVDGGDWMTCKNIKGPLYVARWDPQNYLHGIYNIEVYVKDVMGRTKSERQPFSLDGTRLPFGALSKVALMSNVTFLFQSVFFVTLGLSVLPLCLIRYVHFLVTVGKLVKPRLRRTCSSIWLRKFWILTTLDKIFWPIIIYPVYLTIGPWSIGYIVEDHLGAIFAWGIYVNGTYLPGAFTYAYGFLQLFTFQLPLTLIMANVVDHRFHEIILKNGKKLPLKSRICLHLPFTIIFLMQVVMAYLFWLAYGTLAFLLGPLRTWSLILAAILYYIGTHLSERDIRKAADIWYISSDTSLNHNDLNLSSLDKLN